MKLDEVYEYFKSNQNEFYRKLDNSIRKNNITTNNKTCPMEKLYQEVSRNKVNEKINPTKGQLKIKVLK